MTDSPNLLRIEPQPWMVDPATLAVLEALAAGGAEARFVGGSVRDAVLGRLAPGQARGPISTSPPRRHLSA